MKFEYITKLPYKFSLTFKSTIYFEIIGLNVVIQNLKSIEIRNWKLKKDIKNKFVQL